MKLTWTKNGITILTGDCRQTLKTLPDNSVHCCVTSPPYFGLRDYGHDGQIGLEETPEQYVSEMVAVFREVRRVLRDDGTCWLNLGDSYGGPAGNNQSGMSAIGGGQKTNNGAIFNGRTSAVGTRPKDLIGIPWRVAFALQQPYTNWQIKTEAMRAWTAGIVDGEGCITILKTKSSHSDSVSFPPVVQVRMSDREALDRLVECVGSKIGKEQYPPSHLAAKQRKSWQWKVVSNQAANVIAEIYPYLTVKRRQAIVAWNHQQFRAARGNQERTQNDLEKEMFFKQLINQLNQREQVDIPSWFKEPKVEVTPGWYLRQDLIWAKPNPMPESVTDRCTKSHEYIFLLTKSERYFYDSEAVKEQSVSEPHAPGNKADKDGGHLRNDFGTDSMDRVWGADGRRNRRSVWTVSTKPYGGAHFAVFPPDLIEPCILAGTSEHGCCPDCGTPYRRVVEKDRKATRPGNDTKIGRASDDPDSPYERHSGSVVGNRDPQRHCTVTTTVGWEPGCPCGNISQLPCTVLDPFNGSGTTGEVARKCGCLYIGCELNPEYVALTKQRLQQGNLFV